MHEPISQFTKMITLRFDHLLLSQCLLETVAAIVRVLSELKGFILFHVHHDLLETLFISLDALSCGYACTLA